MQNLSRLYNLTQIYRSITDNAWPPVTGMDIYLWGAGGAGGTVGGWTYGSAGGAGGSVQGKLPLTAATYTVLIGGGGAVNPGTTGAVGGGGAMATNTDNRYGGGGGGYTGLFLGSVSQANAIFIAGGGGGGGSSRAGTGNAGGGGGGSEGQQGFSPYDSKPQFGGGGGTQTAGGAGGSNGGPGSALQGGSSATHTYGGGGGGGYFGGGGGGYSEPNTMGGGGGGSGYILGSIRDKLFFQANGTTPGDSTNVLRGNYGNGGGVGGAGTQGVLILRYIGPARGSGGTITSSGGYTTHTFTTAGTLVIF